MKDFLWAVVSIACGMLAGAAVLLAALSGRAHSPSWAAMTVIWHGAVVIGVVVASYVGGLRS